MRDAQHVFQTSRTVTDMLLQSGLLLVRAADPVVNVFAVSPVILAGNASLQAEHVGAPVEAESQRHFFNILCHCEGEWRTRAEALT